MNRAAILIFAVTLVSGILTGIFSGLYGAFASGWMLSCAITFGTVFYHFAMRLMVGCLIFRSPDPGCGWFQQRGWEPKLYQILRVKRWKKHMPTFRPEQFSRKTNTMDQIIRNCCRAEIVHEVIMVLSFLPVLTIPRLGAPGIFWGTSILSALVDGCFVIMQRYNRPRLQRILAREVSRL